VLDIHSVYLAFIWALIRYSVFLERDSIVHGLRPCFHEICSLVNAEVAQLIALFEKHRADPPLARNQPPISGTLNWARGLKGRAAIARDQLDTVPLAARSGDAATATEALRVFDTTISAFIQGCIDKWVEAASKVKANTLNIPLLKIDGGKQLKAAAFGADLPIVTVNLDDRVLQLIREAAFFKHANVAVPTAFSTVMKQAAELQDYRGMLDNVVRT
jgi:dynein heavy chain